MYFNIIFFNFLDEQMDEIYSTITSTNLTIDQVEIQPSQGFEDLIFYEMWKINLYYLILYFISIFYFPCH